MYIFAIYNNNSCYHQITKQKYSIMDIDFCHVSVMRVDFKKNLESNNQGEHDCSRESREAGYLFFHG
jgi:hypothetical protein